MGHVGTETPHNRTIKGQRPNRALRLSMLVVGFILLYTIVLEWRGLARMHFLQYDYAFFYYAFDQVLNHHSSFASLYNLRVQTIWLKELHYPLNPYNQYVYPPQFAVLFAPLGGLSFHQSALVWMLISIAAYFLAVFYLVRMLWGKVRRIHLIALFIVAAAMTPFEIDAAVANINSVLFFLVVYGFYQLYYRKRPRVAGILFGLAVLMKVTPVAILLIPVIRKQWRVVIWTAICIMAGTLVTTFIIGFGPIWQYVLHFSAFGQTSMKNGPAPYNQSIVGVVGMFQQNGWLFGGKLVQDVIYLVFVLWVLRTLLVRIRRMPTADWRLDMSLAILIPLLFSPLDEQMHMLFVIPSLMLFVHFITDVEHTSFRTGPQVNRKRLAVVTVLGVGILSLPATFALNIITGRFPFLAWMHAQMFFVLVLTFITVVRLYRQTASLPRIVPGVFGSNTVSRRDAL